MPYSNQLKTFIEECEKNPKCCAICGAEEVYQTLVQPVPVRAGLAVVAIAFCSTCLEMPDEKLAKIVQKLIILQIAKPSNVLVIDPAGKIQTRPMIGRHEVRMN
jgi:hypothetical protein